MEKLKFYIWAPAFTPFSGGIMVLYKLADKMSLIGEDVTIVTKNKNNFPVKNFDQSVAIYPEIVNGNPFGSATVVRWILNTPGVCGGDGIYQPDDIVFKYADDYSIPDESMNRGLLTVFNIKDTRKFTNKNKHIPGTVCHLVRKGTGKKQIYHSDHSLCIDNYSNKGGHDYLRTIFDQYETFVSYDHATFISVQAALSGCLSIVIPQEGLSREEWKKKDLYHGYGRSYGLDDQEWAISTQEKLRARIEELEELSTFQIKEMIQTCYTKVNKF